MNFEVVKNFIHEDEIENTYERGTFNIHNWDYSYDTSVSICPTSLNYHLSEAGWTKTAQVHLGKSREDHHDASVWGTAGMCNSCFGTQGNFIYIGTNSKVQKTHTKRPFYFFQEIEDLKSEIKKQKKV